MVEVYILETDRLPDPKINPQIMDGLSVERKEKILRFRRENDRRQSLGAGLLLKECLYRKGIDIKDVTFGRNGKPEVTGVFFNLSHSGNLAVCAISNKEGGCDVEKAGKVKGNIAKRFFSEEENRYLDRFEGDSKQEEFYRLWTMKESYLKMTGEGMSVRLDSFTFRIDDDVKLYRDNIQLPCYIKEYDISGYKLTVCAMEKEFVNNLEWIAFQREDDGGCYD